MFSSKRIIYHFDSCQYLYISLCGWLAQEINFNKELQEFETVIMFLIDSQRQGLCRISSQYKKAIRQGVHGVTRCPQNGQIGRTPDNVPLDIQHFHQGSPLHCIRSATPCNNKKRSHLGHSVCSSGAGKTQVWLHPP